QPLGGEELADGHWRRELDAAAVDRERDHAMALQSSCAACLGSSASKMAEMTAKPRAPASMQERALFALMPPMARRGIFTAVAMSAMSVMPAMGPFGCEVVGKMLPATM